MNKPSVLRVLVTRPNPAGKVLCDLIRAKGDEAVHSPTIDIVPPKDASAFLRAIATISEQDWVIFISPQAVYASLPALQLPKQVQIAAVGTGTATAIEEAGYKVSAVPVSEWNSEGLLALPPFQAMHGQRVAIVRGEGGRQLLDATLSARGARVTHVIAYQRVLPKESITVRDIDVMVCASYEAALNLKQLVGVDAWAYVKTIPLIVMSQRIKKLAEDLGFQRIWVADNASHTAILKMLAEKRNELCQIKSS